MLLNGTKRGKGRKEGGKEGGEGGEEREGEREREGGEGRKAGRHWVVYCYELIGKNHSLPSTFFIFFVAADWHTKMRRFGRGLKGHFHHLLPS